LSRRAAVRLLSIVLATLASTTAATAAQVALIGDTSVSTARPSTNFGTLANLYVGNGNSALLQFDLSTLPAGTISSQIAHATLTVFVNRVNAAGSVTLSPATSAWSESSVTSSTAPSVGATSSIFLASASGQYVTLDVTALVQGWITTPATNFGFALTSDTANLLLDSKENDETAHAATLDITITSQGATGPQGIQGPQGTQGVQGAQGVQGSIGPAGPQGVLGATGPIGSQGIPGVAGANGATGPSGSEGPTGPAGTIGVVSNWSSSTIYQVGQVVFCAACSSNGSSYVALIGNTNQDPPNQTGIWNLIAQQGAIGAQGIQGPVGPIGPSGPIGPIGLAGSAGPTGTTGAIGPIGPIGPIGLTGSAGPTGAAGTFSPAGNWSSANTYQPGQVVYCAACSINGSSYIALGTSTNSATDPSTNTTVWGLVAAGAVGPTGPQGPTGPAGPTGSQGPAGTGGSSGFAWVGNIENASDTATYYTAPTSTTGLSSVNGETSGAGDLYVPAGCTVSGLYVRSQEVFAGNVGTDSTTFVVRHNGAATSMACTVNNNVATVGATATCSNTANTFPVVAQDLIEFEITQTDSTPYLNYSTELVCK
jgi:hypothetical protein